VVQNFVDDFQRGLLGIRIGLDPVFALDIDLADHFVEVVQPGLAVS